MPKQIVFLLVVITLLATACGAAEPTLAPTPTKTATPQVVATTVPTDTPTMVPPTVTPVPEIPTDTPVPLPTDTPLPVENTPEPVDSPTAAAAPTDTPLPPPPRPPTGNLTSMASPDFGAQAFLWWRDDVADRDLTLMENAGFTWVKQWFAWADIEGRGKGQYDWSIPDRIVNQVEQHGLKLLVRVDREPSWAGPPPGNTQHFLDFLAALTSRYKGRIDAIQIWNEPNLAREWGGRPPNPAEYARLLQLAYSTVKSIDPDVNVITAGMAPTGTCCDTAMPDTDFYTQLYQAMGGNSDGYFDMLGVHGAGFAAPPEVSPDETAANKPDYGGERFFSFRHIEDIRNIMVQFGDADKRVVVLEFGWTTDPRPDSPYYWHGRGAGIREKKKADYLRRAYEWAKNNWQPWIGLMSLINMPDLEWTENDEQYWWAIMDPSPVDQLHFRHAYVELCLYFNEQLGRPRCQYAP
ncbi:MAG: beta-galactosidase [Chloroflexota bacterium]|nr:beta-galactosidase [Chloroflexota bacterium]